MNSSMAAVVLILMGGAFLSVAHDSVAADRSNIRSEMLVSTAWLQEHLGDRDLVIIYVGRGRSVYDEGHIPGARFLAFDELVEQHQDSLNNLPPALRCRMCSKASALEMTQGSFFMEMPAACWRRVPTSRSTIWAMRTEPLYSMAAWRSGLQKGSRSSRKQFSQPRRSFTTHLQADILITTAP